VLKVLEWLIVSALTALLAACAGTQVVSTAPPAEIGRKAVIVLSVSHDIGASDGADAIFYLDEARYPGRVVMKSLQDNLSIPVKSDFEDRRGHLYILEVEPGPHTIDGWQVASAGMRITSDTRGSVLRFNIEQGQALYLGNLHAKLLLGRSLFFGMGRAAVDASPEVRDEQSADIALAESRVPALRGRIKVALLPQGPWRAGPNASSQDPVPMPYVPKKK
jgi:hypothetical protein